MKHKVVRRVLSPIKFVSALLATVAVVQSAVAADGDGDVAAAKVWARQEIADPLSAGSGMSGEQKSAWMRQQMLIRNLPGCEQGVTRNCALVENAYQKAVANGEPRALAVVGQMPPASCDVRALQTQCKRGADRSCKHLGVCEAAGKINDGTLPEPAPEASSVASNSGAKPGPAMPTASQDSARVPPLPGVAGDLAAAIAWAKQETADPVVRTPNMNAVELQRLKRQQQIQRYLRPCEKSGGKSVACPSLVEMHKADVAGGE